MPSGQLHNAGRGQVLDTNGFRNFITDISLATLSFIVVAECIEAVVGSESEHKARSNRNVNDGIKTDSAHGSEKTSIPCAAENGNFTVRRQNGRVKITARYFGDYTSAGKGNFYGGQRGKEVVGATKLAITVASEGPYGFLVGT